MLRRQFCSARSLRGAKEVKSLGVILDSSRDMSINDARNLLFARFIGIEKSIPVNVFHLGQNLDISADEARQIDRNIKTIEKLEIPVEKMTIVPSLPGFEHSVSEVLDKLHAKQLIKETSNKRTLFQIPGDSIRLNDMKIGDTQYDHREQITSQRFYIRKSERVFNPNFLFSVAVYASVKQPIVVLDHETNFVQSLYKSAILEHLDYPHGRFLHTPGILHVSGGFLHDKPTMWELLEEIGVDKAALVSYIGHLGYSFKQGDLPKDPTLALQNKMISLKEMSENFVTEMIDEQPSVYDPLDLYKMNKLILRNRIRAIDKPVHQEYMRNFISKWGSEELLDKFQTKQGSELDKTRVKGALWEVSKFSQIRHLSSIFSYNIDGCDQLEAYEQHAPHFQKLAVHDLIRRLYQAIVQEDYFQATDFNEKELGKLVSQFLMAHKYPEPVFKSLDICVFGSHNSGTIFTHKAVLLGLEGLMERLETLYAAVESGALIPKEVAVPNASTAS